MTQILAMTMGDRSGVGPELVANVIGNWVLRLDVRPVVVGDRAVWEEGCRIAGIAPDIAPAASLDALDNGSVLPALLDRPYDAGPVAAGAVSAAAGGEVLDNLRFLVQAARRGDIHGLVYAPLNKQAMKAAGHESADEASFFAASLGVEEATEINTLGEIWTSRITSHVPLSAVAALITREAVEAGILRMHRFLRSIGIKKPRLAVAALNPHAGEGGAFGREEIETIAPAVEAARRQGFRVEGPFPADTVFPTVLKGGFDAVVTMYHDQGQIALKLLGLGRGVTVLAGLPIPVATPGHGTAFDIAGKGLAKPDGLRSATDICARMALAAA